MAFPGQPQTGYSERWGRFHAAMLLAARQSNETQPHQWVPYFDVDPDAEGGPSAGWRQLEARLHAYRLAGVLFTWSWTAGHARLIRQCPVPGATVYIPKEPCVASLQYDQLGFGRRAVDHLTQRGRRRVAWLTVSRNSPLLERS